MRFDTKKQHGIIFERKWFSFLPITINGETRWLEFVKVKGYYFLNNFNDNWYWINLEFVN
jgi:hypothetical protein